jgi:hypothetical protein
MYGGDETSTPALPVRSQTQQHEVIVDDNLSSKNTSNKKKTKAPLPKIITTKLADSTDHNKNFSVRTNDIESEKPSTSDTLFGLTTIKENFDTDEHISNSKYRQDEEIDFNNYFNQNQQKKTKNTAPIIPQSKEKKRSIPSQYDDVRTPSTSISIQMDPPSTFSTISKQSDNKDDSTDEDVDELLGKLEVSVFGKYTHTYIHIFFSLFFFIQSKKSFCLCLYVCVQCIFPVRNFRYQKKA